MNKATIFGGTKFSGGLTVNGAAVYSRQEIVTLAKSSGVSIKTLVSNPIVFVLSNTLDDTFRGFGNKYAKRIPYWYSDRRRGY